MNLKQLNKIESAINSRFGEIPAVHIIQMDVNTTKQQAKEQYELTHQVKPKDKFVYIQILPDDFDYKMADFLHKNEKLYKELIHQGLTVNEIFEKYANNKIQD